MGWWRGKGYTVKKAAEQEQEKVDLHATLVRLRRSAAEVGSRWEWNLRVRWGAGVDWGGGTWGEWDLWRRVAVGDSEVGGVEGSRREAVGGSEMKEMMKEAGGWVDEKEQGMTL